MVVFPVSGLICLLLQIQTEVEGPELAVREAFMPGAAQPGFNFQWNYSEPLGNWDQDEYDDYFIGGNLFDPNGGVGSTSWDYRFSSNPHWSARVKLDHATSQELHFFGGDFEGGGLCNGGGEPWLIGKRLVGFGFEISARSLFDRQDFWSVSVPSHSTYPSATTVKEVFPGGDVNSDGWDEVFYHTLAGDSSGKYFICGVLDGKTQTSLWQNYYPNFSKTPPGYSRVISSGSMDLNQDGIDDHIIGFQDTNLDYNFHALSGVDGSQIWHRADAPGWLLWYRGFTYGDVNLDGVADIVTCFRGAPGFGFPNVGWTEAINGVDGNSIWKLDNADILGHFNQLYGAGYDLWFNETELVVTAGYGPTSGMEAWIVCHSGAIPSGSPREELIIRLNAESGEFLGFADIPRTAFPWGEQALDNVNLTLAFEGLRALGDIDGDGHVEFSMVTALEGSQPNTFDSMLTILGARSLRIPDSASLGESIRLDVHIPSSPGSYWKLLASTQFEPNGGFVLSGWKTHFKADNVYRVVDAQGPRGLLDDQGRASAFIQTPMIPSLNGQTIYSRAVIVDPARPNRIKTVSSVGSTLIR